MIRRLGRILSNHADGERDFVGHIGGDDFIVVFLSENWEMRCRQVLDEFEREVHSLYSREDRQRGGIWSHDRTGRPQFHSLLSLSIGAVSPDPGRCGSHHDVATLATEAKCQAKRRSGSTLFHDRRRGPSSEPALARGA